VNPWLAILSQAIATVCVAWLCYLIIKPERER